MVAVLRDGSLFLIVALLLLLPNQFNAILVKAGFEEGSLVGLKWKSRLASSDQALQAAQVALSDLEKKNDELVKALAEANARLNDPALGRRIETLEEENGQLRESTTQVQETVHQTIESNSALVKQERSPVPRTQSQRTPADFFVGLQTLGVPDAERIALNTKVRSEGYELDPISGSYPADARPYWFATRSTVFYYAGSALPAARRLAAFMSDATGQRFGVQQGAGLGVDPARKAVTLFVHYVVRPG
jgi:hypothetical protein